ncbi:oxygen oxidoreductase [Aureobasidium subglaciale]|nr:oxygen oxidoreductase [Aureobasidium subglaciale]
MSKSEPIAIVGGGAWGLSSALHLHQSGYTNITIFETADSIPSRYSAAYDLNKIVRAEYEESFYTDLALLTLRKQAIEAWKDPLFGPYYHETGYIVATSGSAPTKAKKSLETALASVSKHPVFAPGIQALENSDEFKKYAWQITGPLKGFTGYHNRLAGYAHSANALKGIFLHCATLGIKFVLGKTTGTVTELVYSGQGPSRKCTGIRTADDKVHPATKTILASGAWTASLLPSLGNFVTARSWSVAHVQLTEQECDYLRGIPVINVRDLGFFFEPDPATRLFKLCPLGAGFSNTDAKGTSIPPMERIPQPQDFIPAEDEIKLRKLLQETFPWMADRSFVDKKLCWFADTSDSEYCIDFVPESNNSVVVLSGDSGHGFKMMPIFGKWVVELLENEEQKVDRWRWKTKDERGKDWGDGVSWRIGKGRELSELVDEARRGGLNARL